MLFFVKRKRYGDNLNAMFLDELRGQLTACINYDGKVFHGVSSFFDFDFSVRCGKYFKQSCGVIPAVFAD
jgi:hypothetical protein